MLLVEIQNKYKGNVSKDGKKSMVIDAPTKLHQQHNTPAEINCVRFNAGATMIATALMDKTIRIWSASSLKTCYLQIFAFLQAYEKHIDCILV